MIQSIKHHPSSAKYVKIVIWNITAKKRQEVHQMRTVVKPYGFESESMKLDVKQSKIIHVKDYGGELKKFQVRRLE